jgi:1-acyl-sn-glycerol-3-phosphate acyltransferase
METMEFPNARQTFATSIADIAAGLKEALACEKGCSNTLRRHYYAKIELLRLDVEEFLLEQKIELLNTEEKEEDAVQSFYREITATCDELTRSLKLLPVHRGNSLLTSLDNLFRLLCFNLSILNTGAFCALPLMILKAVLFGRIDSKDSPGEAFRRWIGRYICTMCGFRYEVAGLENVEKTFGSSCSLLAFSHASNLDGFVLASSCPIDMITVAKKELFLLPFFGWISLAIGAVALDRSNRERAVTALQRSAERAQGKRMCISIAPEGTRSTTGQLLPFKKGECESSPASTDRR